MFNDERRLAPPGNIKSRVAAAAANAPYFDQWVKAYPKSYSAHLARGAYWYRMGWAARGYEFIKNQGFAEAIAYLATLSK
jgi:hypothetical protein